MAGARSFRILLKEYFEENFVLAARFITNTGLTYFERCWWFVWILLSFAACCFSVALTYQQWNADPVVITYGSRFLPITTIPFPAVTICPLVKSRVEAFNLSSAYEMVQNGSILSIESRMKLRTLAHVCPMSAHWPKFRRSSQETFLQTLRKISSPLIESIHLCLWRFRMIPCENLLTETLLDDGICYTFNGLSINETYRTNAISADFTSFASTAEASKWTRAKGYEANAGLNAYPRRPLASGIYSGLFLLPTFRKEDHNELCSGPYSGYKVAIHAPDELPRTEDEFYRISVSTALGLSIKPEVLKISSRLKAVSPLRRKCFFNHERYLRYFRTYNQLNCVVECIANYTLKKCGCVKFSMPRAPDMEVCDASRINCYQTAYVSLYEQAIRNYLTHRPLRACGCFPACYSIKYNVETHHSPINFTRIKANTNPYNVSSHEDYVAAALLVSFKDRHYLPLWRRDLLGSTDAVAKVGGFFALLLGASAMSLGELIYYCCVRPLRRERPREPRRPQVQMVQPWGLP